MRLVVGFFLFFMFLCWSLEHFWVGLDKKAKNEPWHAYMNIGSIMLLATSIFFIVCVIPLI